MSLWSLCEHRWKLNSINFQLWHADIGQEGLGELAHLLEHVLEFWWREKILTPSKKCAKEVQKNF